MQIHLINLGCARNQVDSEIMTGRLEKAGHDFTEDPAQAEAIIINTCCFIEDAASESIDTILAAAAFKETGCCRRLIVAGCLPERYREEVRDALPEADFFLGTGAYDRIVDALAEEIEGPAPCLLPDPDSLAPQTTDTPRARPQGPMAYLKIAEGCDRQCTFCIIPRLRGRQKSRPLHDILQEARKMVATGIKELVLVGQETTRYGADRPNADEGLADLLAELSALSEDLWIRFMYGHPDSLSDTILQTVASHANLCPYFDIPIQHVSAPVLRRMGRPYDPSRITQLVRHIRASMPEAALRTTVIVGFPGETDDDFDQLRHFIETVPFDHLGVFTYSDADDLTSHRLPDHVPPDVGQQRRDILMARQMGISEALNQKYLGRHIDVLLEESPESGLFIGRTMFQAPEVDGLTYVRPIMPGTPMAVGQFVRTRIVDTLEYDLVGEPE
jgi:ribosomal protein S12 methylthiotransferase